MLKYHLDLFHTTLLILYTWLNQCLDTNRSGYTKVDNKRWTKCGGHKKIDILSVYIVKMDLTAVRREFFLPPPHPSKS